MDIPKKNKIPLPKAIIYILLVTLCVNGGFLIALEYYNSLKNRRQTEGKYQVVAIVQATDEAEPLKTMCLAELLNLSCDKPSNLYRFNVSEALDMLYRSAIIKEAKIQKILPGTLYIEYSLRHPVAYLADYTNTVLDEKGILFPHKPYLTPKNLPEIAFGLEEESGFKWGQSLPKEKLDLALKILEIIKAFPSLSVEKIDLSRAFLQSEGQSEIVLKIKSGQGVSKILRLKSYDVVQSIAHFVRLDQWASRTKQMEWCEQIQIIDLRVQGLGYISTAELKSDNG